MGGSKQPFLYPPCAPLSQRQEPSAYANFNPRAATEASYRAAEGQRRPRSAQDGPLLQFDGENVNYTSKAYEGLQSRNKPAVDYNQHPDSWTTIVAGHPVQYKPMPANTKTRVKSIRWVQFALRVITIVGATGILVLMICFQNLSNVFSWVERIAPAWDLISTLYAIYHLWRPANARTPASSASYHVFAIVTDLGLLPFYIIMSLTAHSNSLQTYKNPSRWTSLLSKPQDTWDLIFATFIGAAAIAGLHLFSALLDVYLIYIFRKIAALPPDVNPLEDNLTSRAASRNSKHKYKNSEVTLTGDSWSEKKPGFMSGSTLEVGRLSRISTASPDADRKIPFTHTRMQSDDGFSPHTPLTAQLSQQHFEEVHLSSRPRGTPSRLSPDPTADLSWPPQLRDRASRPGSAATMSREVDVTDFARTASPALPNAAPSQATVKSQQKDNLLNDNWYVLGEDNSTLGGNSRGQTPGLDDVDDDDESAHHISFMPQPLRMNPPTPPMNDDEFPDAEDDTPSYPAVKRKPLATRDDNGNGNLGRNLTVQSKETTASSVYSDDETSQSNVRVGTPKRKYYGDLAAATRGVLGTVKYKTTPNADRILSNETVKSNGTVDAAAMDSTGFSALSSYGYGRFPSGKHGKKKDRGARVVSTGVEIVDVGNDYGSSIVSGIRGRRDVSGKVAEEGRGGGWWSRKGH